MHINGTSGGGMQQHKCSINVVLHWRNLLINKNVEKGIFFATKNTYWSIQSHLGTKNMVGCFKTNFIEDDNLNGRL